jgi:hypothetical protein
MGSFSPDYVNTWTISKLEAVAATKNEIEKEGTCHDVLMRRWDDNDVLSCADVPLETRLQQMPLYRRQKADVNDSFSNNKEM